MLIIFYDDELLFWQNAHFKKDLLCYVGDSHNASWCIVFNLTKTITCNSASWFSSLYTSLTCYTFVKQVLAQHVLTLNIWEILTQGNFLCNFIS